MIKLPTVSDEDVKRLKPIVASWNILNEMFLLDPLSSEDLLRLVIVEARTNNREEILDRIIARLKTRVKEEILEALKNETK